VDEVFSVLGFTMEDVIGLLKRQVSQVKDPDDVILLLILGEVVLTRVEPMCLWHCLMAVDI
jgi:hypothetical protein